MTTNPGLPVWEDLMYYKRDPEDNVPYCAKDQCPYCGASVYLDKNDKNIRPGSNARWVLKCSKKDCAKPLRVFDVVEGVYSRNDKLKREGGK